MFAFGGIKSTDPLVWDIRDIKEVRTAFYPRMGMNEDEEEIKLQEERDKRRSKRADRAKKFKEIISKSAEANAAAAASSNNSSFNTKKKLGRQV